MDDSGAKRNETNLVILGRKGPGFMPPTQGSTLPTCNAGKAAHGKNVWIASAATASAFLRPTMVLRAQVIHDPPASGATRGRGVHYQ
jgi:hypothetical protein